MLGLQHRLCCSGELHCWCSAFSWKRGRKLSATIEKYSKSSALALLLQRLLFGVEEILGKRNVFAKRFFVCIMYP